MNDLTTLVRRSLDERSRDLPAAPPPWSRISAGLSAVRRRRRRRQAGFVGAVAVVVVLGAVASGVTPTALRRTEPATPDGPVRAGAVFGGRTVGSLARDRAFLADLRREVLASGQAFGEEAPQVFRPEDVLVPFAGDVGDLRIALLEVEVGDANGVTERFLWLTANKGAPASDVARHAYELDDAGPVASLWLPTPSGEPARDGVGGLVVLSAAGERTDLRLAVGLPELTDNGRLQWGLQDLPPLSPGHWETAVPWQLKDVTAGWWAFPDSRKWNELELPYTDTSGFGFVSDKALHGGAPAQGAAVSRALADAQAASRTAVESSLRTLLWTGTTGRWTLSVVAVTTPSGAHVITVEQVRDSVVVPSDVVTAAPVLRPAGPLEQVCLAVPTRDPATRDAALLVLGPVGAARAVVGAGSPVALTDEAAVVDAAPDGTRVDFLDAAGASLCSTAVGATTDRFVPHG